MILILPIVILYLFDSTSSSQLFFPENAKSWPIFLKLKRQATHTFWPMNFYDFPICLQMFNIKFNI